MAPGPALLEIGRIDKAHGVRGEVLVTLVSDRIERLAKGSRLKTNRNTELQVVASRPHQHRWIVLFDGITDRDVAEGLRGTVLLAEPMEGEDDTLWVHELVGAEVCTPDGQSWGRVVSVIANAASDLIELADGTLIPVVFVADSSGLPDRLVVDPPPGLLGDDAE